MDGGHGGRAVGRPHMSIETMEQHCAFISPGVKRSNRIVTTPSIAKPRNPERIFLEVSQLAKLLTDGHLVCGSCGGAPELQLDHVGISTVPTLKCIGCKKEVVAAVSHTASIPSETPRANRLRLTNTSVNVFCVLAFLSCGDGGSEAQRVLGLLDLPTSTSMEKSTFTRIERKLHPTILSYASEPLLQNLILEVEASCIDSGTFDFERWRLAVTEADTTHPTGLHPAIAGSNDMGWQKRSSGRRYDSLSGHSFMCGAKLREPIAMALLQKFCRICSVHEEKEMQAAEHECVANHTGSGGSNCTCRCVSRALRQQILSLVNHCDG